MRRSFHMYVDQWLCDNRGSTHAGQVRLYIRACR